MTTAIKWIRKSGFAIQHKARQNADGRIVPECGAKFADYRDVEQSEYPFPLSPKCHSCCPNLERITLEISYRAYEVLRFEPAYYFLASLVLEDIAKLPEDRMEELLEMYVLPEGAPPSPPSSRK